MDGKEITAIFAVCSRQLNRLALKTGDKFFSKLYAKEADKLLSGFVGFLKTRGETQNIPQCRTLIFQIQNTLNLLEVFKHLQITEPTTPLLLEKNLLLLKLAILDTCRTSPLPKAGGASVKKPKKKSNASPRALSETHNQISDLIRSRDRIQNMEIFSQFPAISKRTLKRKLSELIKSGVITRRTEGKKVFYAIS